MHEKISRYIKVLQGFADRWWYAPFIGFLAAIDNFVIVIPNDGILISSSMLIPKRWLLFAVTVAIGSTVGGALLAAFVNFHGLPWILEIYPSLEKAGTWIWTVEFFDRFGLLLVLLVAMTPIAQQPTVILATVSHTPIWQIAAVIFVGRMTKFLIMSYIGSHAPKLLSKIWGLQNELEEVGIKVDPTKN